MSTLHRQRKGELTYRAYLKTAHQDGCVFCAFTKDGADVVKSYRYFYEVVNIFPYTLWDSSKVVKHHLLVPKRHITSLAQMTASESAQYMKITSAMEKAGYDIFARGVSSTMKSIPHQHTHLITTTGAKIKGMVYNESPLVTIYRY